MGWAPAGEGFEEDAEIVRWDWANRQELLAKCCFATWLITQKNEMCQGAFCEVSGISVMARLLQPTNDDTLLEMVAGAICALCEGSEQNKMQFREDHGLEPLIRLLDHKAEAVQLNSAKALCHLSETEENRRIIRELGGLDKLVKLLA